ncbi:OmpA family protein [Stenotrophomonas sp. Iso1]|uniref:OmpA family protein n=1 Tax=Stenotrophomonas sp. Iso1 TaxID=2977283 RepID=UPI0022B77314|nr:OmpA family protein [Stenotrophomonas sp. Iso1]
MRSAVMAWGRCLSVLPVFLLAGIPASGAALAVADGAFGGHFTESARVGEDQAQVIYYRAADALAAGAANVYLDQELVTALKPGGYTVFCLTPGRHTLGAYLDDAPDYSGKTRELYAAAFKAGATYYLKVREEGLNQPMPVNKTTAEAELGDTREQIHLLSRASRAEPCRYYDFLDDPTFSVRDFTVLADTAFNARGGMTNDGSRAVAAILAGLEQVNAQIIRVEVEGHTDPMGAGANNQAQAQRWADGVRRALIERGVPQSVVVATSAGSRNLVQHSCYGSHVEQQVCYAPNRRVMVRVQVRTVKAR